jgi:hypothetical protein
MQSISLRPCPFCGERPQWFKTYINMAQHPVYSLQCMNPGCRISPMTDLCDTPAEAADAWNRRKEG